MIIVESIGEGWKHRALGRLLSLVDDTNGTGCWEWRGGILKSGYGHFYYGAFDGKQKSGKVHRAAWVLMRGDVPDSLQVLHRCNNRRCCNPNHLYLGTHAQNMKDREKAGRTSRGRHRYNFKRDESLNAQIGALRAEGLRIEDICARLHIGRTTYYRCVAAGAVDAEANKRARSANASAAMGLRA
ncbi:HNH endonuclease signature motif containing protein [Burkholderia cenocepacia]|uniref:HNH endonuclease signature motif containing protein n=1 Tax=Burkholderia cenocepacia TaxID=95486 RepID=UPI002018BB06|nr:HNH endonuclease signature motif containing protein [Burkholderia cenocepacia]MCO1396418.1 HNH endonuclease [Burkholderia cenocepacia]MCO1408992.1 HNH endonuclease [Burkholderia cenocepacia]UQN92033.1 HNH endonuclease [Burkholderia cenocepacia]UQN99182.1 HNH endonuclease [Burkholderia cenocepacia]UQP50863.1 HNH endonuclease [Burkholderia cenocepacia]